MVPKLVKPDVHQNVAEVFAIVVEEVVVEIPMAVVEVEVAPGLQLGRKSSSPPTHISPNTLSLSWGKSDFGREN